MIGQTISHYKILEKIGAGGMGIVYKAEDIKLKRTVALKFLPPELTRDQEAKKRFLHEARAASALDHLNICNIYEIDETDEGQMFMAMAYYRGKTLKEKLASLPLPIAEAIDIAIQIAQGLHEAHQNHIIHRDIKPANIIITDKGQVKILDFGLAKLRGATRLTKEGTTLGTVAYMSPEQAAGEKVDHRSDIWSLGVILYEMITGQLPFKGEYDLAVMYAIMNEDPERITAVRSGLSHEIEDIIVKTLNKNPAERYQHLDDLLVDLKRAKGDSTTGRKASAVKRRKPIRSVLVAAVVLFTAFLAGYFIVNTTFQRKKPPALEKPMLMVLPFENLGNPEDAYFTDGMHEEVTTRLAMVKNLGVISRISARKYLDSTKSIKEIGQELSIQYVLKGTVRWARSKTDPEKIRISTHLIRVADDTLIWADTYDRVINDVFEVQTDIARRVAAELNITLEESERRFVEITYTKNVEAYHAFLRAEYLIDQPHFTQDMWPEVIRNYEKAVELDPEFALAWAELARAHARLVFFNLDLSPERRQKAIRTAERAMKLNPGSPQIHLALSYYNLWISRNPQKALKELKIAQAGMPSNTHVMFAKSSIYELQGRFDESIMFMKKAHQLNPLSTSILIQMALDYWFTRQYQACIEASDKALALVPDEDWAHLHKVVGYWSWKGAVPEARMSIEKTRKSHSWVPYVWFWQEIGERKFQQALQRLETNQIEWIDIKISKIPRSQAEAYLFEFMGKREQSRQSLKKAKKILEAEILKSPEDPRLHSALGIALASLGEREAALREGSRAYEILPVDRDAVYGTPFIHDLGLIHTILGEYDLALDQVEYLFLKIPSVFSPGWMKLDPRWDRLKDLPRFLTIMEKYRMKFKHLYEQ
jgi:serine/threonine protein kinase/tetratricopeptide (TPR) repeat protein